MGSSADIPPCGSRPRPLRVSAPCRCLDRSTAPAWDEPRSPATDRRRVPMARQRDRGRLSVAASPDPAKQRTEWRQPCRRASRLMDQLGVALSNRRSCSPAARSAIISGTRSSNEFSRSFGAYQSPAGDSARLQPPCPRDAAEFRSRSGGRSTRQACKHRRAHTTNPRGQKYRCPFQGLPGVGERREDRAYVGWERVEDPVASLSPIERDSRVIVEPFGRGAVVGVIDRAEGRRSALTYSSRFRRRYPSMLMSSGARTPSRTSSIAARMEASAGSTPV